jgi:GT2 family glycosyltransferase
MYAPIVLFVYNRPAHTRQTVEALQKNEMAKDSDLIIYSDAPKKPEAAPEVFEVRKYIRDIGGFKSIKIIEREKNWGLANSIIDGVTSVVNEYGRIIVLEDDLVTSPYFLSFMNEALETYQDDEKVMHISGYMFPIDSAGLLETFFLRTASCWGWATWSRAWGHFEKKPDKLLSKFTKQAINKFNLDGTCNFWAQVEGNESGKMDTWAVFWYATVFQKEGLCLHPRYSMVNNIGHDGTGVHCGSSDSFGVSLAIKPIQYFETSLVENTLALQKTGVYFSPPKPALLTKVVKALKNRYFQF